MAYNKKFMIKAIELSIQNIERGGGPFGAVIVKDGKIIGEGSNSVTIDNDPTAHAEINAIKIACKILQTFSLENCEIYSSCEPCPMCLSAIYWAKLSKVYFANTKTDAAKINFADDFIYQELGKKPKNRIIPMQNEDRDLAIKAFEVWSMKEDKILY